MDAEEDVGFGRESKKVRSDRTKENPVVFRGRMAKDMERRSIGGPFHAVSIHFQE